MTRTALVAGATGLIGNHLLYLLLNDPRYAKVTALVRRQTPHSHPKLEQRVVDFEKLEELPDFVFQVNDVFCCLGTTIRAAGSKEAFRRVDYDYIVSLARCASRAECKNLIVVSAVDADSKSQVFYNRVKGETESALRSLPLPSLAILRPSLLLGKRIERRPAERIAIRLVPLLRFALRGRFRKYRPITAEKVAMAMLAEANRDSAGTRVLEGSDLESLAAAAHRT